MNRWFGCLLGMAVVSFAHAQVRAPANPLQTLPRTETPQQAKVEVNVQAPSEALQALLARQLTPTRFDVAGVKSVPFAEVAGLFAPMRGKAVTIGDLVAAANKVNAVYQKHGFALSFAFIPNQNFADGVVGVTVVEGYVTQVDVRGDAGNMDKRIRAIAAHVVGERPLRQATFERYTQLLGQLPGATVAANVATPTTTDGATTLVLDVTRKRYDISYGLDFNHPGTQGVFTAMENGATPLAEQLSLATLFPNGGGQRLYTGRWTEPFGSDGWQGQIDANRYWGRPDTDDQLPAYLDHQLNIDRLALSAIYPLRLTNSERLNLNLSTYAARQDDRYRNIESGAAIALQSSIRVLAAELTWTKVNGKSSRQFSVNVMHGFDAFGAYSRATANRALASPIPTPDVKYTRYMMALVLADPWPHGFATVFRAMGQYSDASLPSSEQVNFGGPIYGLAYDPGEAGGDSGWAASGEINRAFTLSSRWVTGLTPYVTYQAARVFLNRAKPLVDRLDSAAVGIRASDGKHYSFDFGWAWPTGDRPVENRNRDPRWNLTFSYNFR